MSFFSVWLLIAFPPSPTSPAASPAAGHYDLPTMLFVFMLASFIGLGVITRVSRLLHTPLMSLTNAISAIAIVGAITVTGVAHGGGQAPRGNFIVLDHQLPGRDRPVRLDGQHRQRLFDHRPDAEDVQKAEPRSQPEP